jgi:hypothetical protein
MKKFSPPKPVVVPSSSVDGMHIESKQDIIVACPGRARDRPDRHQEPQGDTLKFVIVPTPWHEIEWTAAAVKILVEKNGRCSSTSAASVAVLSRNSSILPLISKRLGEIGVPNTVVGDGSPGDSTCDIDRGAHRFWRQKCVIIHLSFLGVLIDER